MRILNNIYKHRFLFVIFCIPLLTTCKRAFNTPAYTSGTANFSNYISVGNSLTQGYTNGGVYEAGQRNSYPSMIAQQMKLVQPNMQPFIQPYFTGNGSGYMHLAWKNNTIQVVQPADSGGYKQDPAFYGQTYVGQQLSNMGVSGIKLIGIGADPTIPGDDLNAYLLAGNNPYFKRMFGLGPLPPGNSIFYINDIAKRSHTFFTCWLGNNDILGYATNGGYSEPITFSGTTFYVYGLSDPVQFRKKYDMALDSLCKNGAKGIVMTIPNVTSIPYFHVVKLQNLKNSDGSEVKVYITTNTGIRLATHDDVLLLPLANKLGKFLRDSIDGGPVVDSSGSIYQVYCPSPYGLDPHNPVKNVEVLDRDEFPAIAPATAALNAQIRASAAAHNIPVVDMGEFLTNFESGFNLNGITFTTQYIQGGVFGLDGVHPNARGYAIIANEIIGSINSYYKSNIPLVNINNYKGITFP